MSERHQDMCLKCEEEVWRHNVPLKAEHKHENRTGEESSVVGNAAAMRKALERIRREFILDSCLRNVSAFHAIVCEITYSALTAHPRNCDIFSKDEVLEMLKDRSFSKEDTIEWLYDEAKKDV